MAALSPHAALRLASGRIPACDIRDIQRAALRAADEHESAAVIVHRYPDVRSWDYQSNGDTVWAVVRGGTVVTVMLRRSTQPCTPETFRVREVVA